VTVSRGEQVSIRHFLRLKAEQLLIVFIEAPARIRLPARKCAGNPLALIFTSHLTGLFHCPSSYAYFDQRIQEQSALHMVYTFCSENRKNTSLQI
jgi:hypothetical protein